MKTLVESRGGAPAPTSAGGEQTASAPAVTKTADPSTQPTGDGAAGQTPAATVPKVTIRVRGVPGSQARDVLKVAVLPLNAVSSEVTLELTIRADGGLAGIPRETLNLVVREGLRQLGLDDPEIEEG